MGMPRIQFVMMMEIRLVNHDVGAVMSCVFGRARLQ